jgi:hypothetical protein
MIQRSDEQADLGAALSKAQAAIRSAEKDRQNPHLRNRYATLESVIRATRPHLGAHGLSLTCAPVAEDNRAGVAWTLRHASGQWESGVLLMPLGQSRGITPAQALGSVVTYAHRYVRMHLLGCAAGDDVDGEDVATKQARREARRDDRPGTNRSSSPPNRDQSTRPAASNGDQSAEQGAPIDTKSKAWRAWQARLGESGVEYEQVATWCQAHDRPRPSKMSTHQWRQLCQWLDNGGAEVVQRWKP